MNDCRHCGSGRWAFLAWTPSLAATFIFKFIGTMRFASSFPLNYHVVTLVGLNQNPKEQFGQLVMFRVCYRCSTCLSVDREMQCGVLHMLYSNIITFSNVMIIIMIWS